LAAPSIARPYLQLRPVPVVEPPTSRQPRISAWIDRYPGRAFFALTAFYVAVVFILSSVKLLWLDELITLHIARLGSVSAIWHALAHGADPNPPLTHMLVLACMRLFGEHEFALRLPAMIGYWIGMLALFQFLRRWVSGTWALAGVAMSMSMAAFQYSYESRSYGIFYGLAMLAVYCWGRAVDPTTSSTRRWLALLGMVAALAAGISTSYFAVLAFFPIAAGEIALTLERWRQAGWREDSFLRSIQLRIWTGMAIAATPLLLFRSLIQHAIAEFGPHAWNKVSFDQVSDSYTEMVEYILFPLLALLLFAIVILVLSRFCAHCRASIRPRWIGSLATEQAYFKCSRLPFHQAVAVFSLMAYPILGYLVASIHGGMLSPRFVIPVCFGFAIAGTMACYRIFGHMRFAAVTLLLLCTVWFCVRESVIAYWYSEQKQCFYKVVDRFPIAEFPDGPIAIPDPLLALTFRHYAPPSLAARVVFPVDFPAIRHDRGDDSPEQNLWAGRNSIYHLPIVTLASLQHSAGKYVIVTHDQNWMLQDLLQHRYPIQRLDINTRATAIGGFTPLSHGPPVFYSAAGDKFFQTHPGFVLAPIPLQRAENLPAGKLSVAEGGDFSRSQYPVSLASARAAPGW
jgi:Dolichyl-phosphate-mannose-protein mannosyltransferase